MDGQRIAIQPTYSRAKPKKPFAPAGAPGRRPEATSSPTHPNLSTHPNHPNHPNHSTPPPPGRSSSPGAAADMEFDYEDPEVFADAYYLPPPTRKPSIFMQVLPYIIALLVVIVIIGFAYYIWTTMQQQKEQREQLQQYMMYPPSHLHATSSSLGTGPRAGPGPVRGPHQVLYSQQGQQQHVEQHGQQQHGQQHHAPEGQQHGQQLSADDEEKYTVVTITDEDEETESGSAAHATPGGSLHSKAELMKLVIASRQQSAAAATEAAEAKQAVSSVPQLAPSVHPESQPEIHEIEEFDTEQSVSANGIMKDFDTFMQRQEIFESSIITDNFQIPS